RRQPLPLPNGGPAASLIKHADEQTVVALAAVAAAIRDHRLETTDFSAWGVLAGPRYPGRAALVPALARVRAEGAWGMSPHLIPPEPGHGGAAVVALIRRRQSAVGSGQSSQAGLTLALVGAGPDRRPPTADCRLPDVLALLDGAAAAGSARCELPDGGHIEA